MRVFSVCTDKENELPVYRDEMEGADWCVNTTHSAFNRTGITRDDGVCIVNVTEFRDKVLSSPNGEKYSQ